jgi:intracellular septation protein
MQLLLDFMPVFAFFIAYLLADIYVATAVLIVAVLIQTAVSLIRHRKVSPMLLTSAALVLVFGGITLILHDATFIKWKPTLLNLLLAVAFAASHFMRGPTIVQRMIGEGLKLAAADWRRLNLMWIGFFLFAGAANLYVAYSFAEATWVKFKVFGLLGLTLMFVLLQGVWLSRRAAADEPGTN